MAAPDRAPSRIGRAHRGRGRLRRCRPLPLRPAHRTRTAPTGAMACHGLQATGRSAAGRHERSAFMTDLVMNSGRVASCSTRIPLVGTRHLDERHRRGGIKYFGRSLTSAVPNAPGFEVRLDATRRDPTSGNAPPEHGGGCARAPLAGAGGDAAGRGSDLVRLERLDRQRRYERALRAQLSKRRPCGRLREVRIESLRAHIVAPASPPADGAEVVHTLAASTDRCEGRGRRDALSAWLRQQGFGSGLSAHGRPSLPFPRPEAAEGAFRGMSPGGGR